MKPAEPTVAFAVRTARGEQRRIRSFLDQVEGLGVQVEDLPRTSVRALDEADKFLGRYLDLLARETPSTDQLVGVIEALGGIDRVVKRAMAEILKSLGWRPDKDLPPPKKLAPGARRTARNGKNAKGGTVISFPGPRSRRPRH